jgi:hypothetical protein
MEREDKNESRTGLSGVLTERHLDLAEAEFPGLSRFYERCIPRPATFLELLARFGAFEPFARLGQQT